MTMIDTFCKDLDTILTSQIDYYEYLLSRYYNDTSIDLRANYTVPYYNMGWNVPEDEDLEQSAYVNVTKSVIDTLVSKLANQKVRPYFNPINGTWKTKKTVKAVQQYFDVLYDNLHVNRVVREAFRNACIFSKGYIFFNPLSSRLMSLGAFECTTLLSEERYTEKTKCLIRFLNFPSHMVRDYTGKDYECSKKTVNLRHYFDTQSKKQIVYIDNTEFLNEKYESDVLPIVTLYYTDPVFGSQTTSVVKELDGIQTQINYINDQISETTQRNMANMFFVNEGSTLAPRDLSNKAGIVYSVKSPAGSNGMSNPVTQVTPRLCDPQWVELLQMYIKQAYDICGISELSAMGKNILGDNASGAALQSMENIEGDRQQSQLDNYVHAYVDLANMIISVMPKDDDILPKAMNNSGMKWKDIVRQKDLFKVQYSAATSLSKDPAEKRKEILQMSQAGLITADKISRYLDQPDLEDAYKEAASIADGVYQCIERAIENEEYDVPDWIDYELLAKNITITENELYSSINDNEKDDSEVMKALQKLRRLEENLFMVMQENGFVSSEEQDEMATSEEGIATGGDAVDVKDITTQMDNSQSAVGPETNESVDTMDGMAETNPVETS